MFMIRCHRAWWLNVFPMRVKTRGYPGTVMKFLNNDLCSGTIFQARKIRTFIPMSTNVVAAAGGMSGHNRAFFGGGV